MLNLEFPLRSFVLYSSFLVIRYFLIAGLAYLLVWRFLAKKQTLFNTKSLAHAPLRPSQIKKEIFHSIVTSIAFSSGGLGLAYLKSKSIGMWYTSISDFGVSYFIVTILFMLIVNDAYFYWTHRLLHTPKIFKFVHRVHHYSVNPTPFTSLSFDLVEIFVNMIIVFLFPFIMPMHILAFAIFTLVAFLYNVYGHLGYEIMPPKLQRLPLFKYFNSATRHQFHHQTSRANFGLYFTWWDHICGTYSESSRERAIPPLEALNFEKS